MLKLNLKKAGVLEQNKIYTMESSVEGSSVIKYIRWKSTGKTEFKSPQTLESRLGVLEIQFTSGTAYKFLDVPKEVFEGLFKSESSGRFFNENIRGKYIYEQLKNPIARDNSIFKADTLQSVVKKLKKDDDVVYINSSGIKCVRYNNEFNSLDVEFDTGNCYSFKDVSKSTYDEFIQSPSKGSFYNKNIKTDNFIELEKETLSEPFV